MNESEPAYLIARAFVPGFVDEAVELFLSVVVIFIVVWVVDVLLIFWPIALLFAIAWAVWACTSGSTAAATHAATPADFRRVQGEECARRTADVKTLLERRDIRATASRTTCRSRAEVACEEMALRRRIACDDRAAPAVSTRTRLISSYCWRSESVVHEGAPRLPRALYDEEGSRSAIAIAVRRAFRSSF
jgi:hypothetical protein